MSKAVIFFAEGTEECEALLPLDLLRRAGVDVVLASVTNALTVVSSHGVRILADALANDVDYTKVDMLVLPGGMPGTVRLGECRIVTETIAAFLQQGKLVAAICAAPSILSQMGLLVGRTATAHADFRDKLTGAIVVDEEVVEDGNLITSYGLGGALPFALALVRRLAGVAEAERIRAAVEYTH